ncbi:DUF6753 family protein [Tolypothrix sp. VBCCA 56010]|uniref:DUF6753 family protein n=1 Tax=Tolypothrix sp. VBCCA 56010 TaxID=3137731 RepID=UPI003D7C8873
MLSNQSNGGKPEMDLLDKVLADKPPEVKARVLEVVYRLGISPKDELFLVMLALGYLQILIQDSPKEWEDLFLDFKNELDQWTDSNLEILDSLVRKAETEEMLAKNSQQLVAVLTNLTNCCNQLMTAVQTSGSRNSSSLVNNFSFPDEILHKINALQEQNAQVSRLLNHLSRKGNGKPWGRRMQLIFSITTVVVLTFGWHVWGTVSDTNLRARWILEKEVRSECLTGLKSKTSKECRGVLYHD